MKHLFTKRNFSILLSCLFLVSSSSSILAKQQDITDNKDSLRYYLAQRKFSIDSNADAVILYESGSSLLYEQGSASAYDKNAYQRPGGTTLAYKISKLSPSYNLLTYRVERTLKILSPKAVLEAGIIAIPVSGNVTIKKVSGVTYNLEQDKVITQNLDKADIVRDRVTDEVKALKFSLPALKVGSILHYSFTLEYFTFTGIPDWNFQHRYPVLFSEYETSVPAATVFSDLSRTSIPFVTVSKKDDLDQQIAGIFKFSRGSLGNENTIWVRRNVPALKDEPFRKGDDNYTERVRIRKLRWNWKQVSEFLYNDKDIFFRAYAPNSFLKDKVTQLTSGRSTDLEKARSIFAFVRDSFVIDNNNPIPEIQLRSIFNSRRGTFTDINILLTAMLRKANLNSELVILATKPSEPLSELYPDIQDMNYLISKVNIEGKDYFLDAAPKYLPFGMLLPECYNGYGRVISANSYSVNISPDRLMDQNTAFARLSLDTTDGWVLHLKLDEKLDGVTALQYRQAWKGDVLKAQKRLRADFEHDQFQLTKITVENISDPDKPLMIHMEAQSALNGAKDLIYLNPYFYCFFKKNPFTIGNREFPVDLDHEYNLNYFLNFNYPSCYKLDDYPKSEILKFQDDLMHFKNIMKADTLKNTFSLNSHFETQTTFFPLAVYPSLRSFFEEMIVDQHKEIVLKKVN